MNHKKSIILITGKSGTGKTLLISNLIAEINKLNIRATGIYSPARFKFGIKTGIYVEDITSHKKKLLANFDPGWDPENSKREWRMDPKVLQWGDMIIRNSVPTSVLIIDELGFLEFEKNLGWLSAFEILDDGIYKIAIVVVRISLLKQALAKWESSKVVYMDEPLRYKEHINYLLDQIVVASTI